MIRHVAMVLAILLVAAVPAQAVEAQGAGRGIGAPPVGANPAGHHSPNRRSPSHHSPNHHALQHRSLHRYPLIPFGGRFVYAPPAWFGSYASYAPAPVYASPGMYSEPVSSTVSIASAPYSMPSVIPFPTGRYELWGDGLTSPYQWVWIPNPPPAPPAAPPMSAPAPGTPQPPEPAASPRSPLYRWIDAEGIVNWTQGWDTVPEQYRDQLTRRRPS